MAMLQLQGHMQARREKTAHITCKIITPGTEIHPAEPHAFSKKIHQQTTSMHSRF